MTDPFATHADSVFAPARRVFAIAPHDSDPLPMVVKALYVGTGGNVVLRSVDGTQDITFRNVGAGQVLDVRAQAVRATGTTAGDIVGLA